MRGAAHPAKGNWLYYVNGDKAGHLFFTNSEAKFDPGRRTLPHAQLGLRVK